MSEIDLTTGISKSCFVGYGWDTDPMEVVNGVSITNVGKYVKRSDKIEKSQFFNVLPMHKDMCVNTALGNCLLVTLDQETLEVSVWYIA
jgi:hypothetical protein